MHLLLTSSDLGDICKFTVSRKGRLGRPQYLIPADQLGDEQWKEIHNMRAYLGKRAHECRAEVGFDLGETLTEESGFYSVKREH